MSMGSAIASGASSGGPYSDLNSLGGIHYGAGLWNSADPLDIFGHSGSNIGANITNPLGSGLINGNIPNNGVNPLEAQRWGGTAAPTGLPAPAGSVNPLMYSSKSSYVPLAQGGVYNGMANALARGPGGGSYADQVNQLAPPVAVSTNNPYAYVASPRVLPFGALSPAVPKGRLQP